MHDEIKPPVKELICQRCECDYPVWFAPNELWNATCRITEPEIQFLCLTCFAILAKRTGIDTLAWVVTTKEIGFEGKK